MRASTLALPLVAAACLLAPFPATGEIYKWVDSEGVTHYSTVVPQGERPKEVQLPPAPPKERLEEAQRKWQSRLEEQRKTQLPQQVFGTVGFLFWRSKGEMPESPVSVTLEIEPIPPVREEPIRHKIVDPEPFFTVTATSYVKWAWADHNFELDLSPGNYRISGIQIEVLSLSEDPISLPVNGPIFRVPEGQCSYLGIASYAFLILPPSSKEQALASISRRAEKLGKQLEFVYLPKGSLVRLSQHVSMPPEEKSPHNYAILERATKRGCLIGTAEQH